MEICSTPTASHFVANNYANALKKNGHYITGLAIKKASLLLKENSITTSELMLPLCSAVSPMMPLDVHQSSSQMAHYLSPHYLSMVVESPPRGPVWWHHCDDDQEEEEWRIMWGTALLKSWCPSIQLWGSIMDGIIDFDFGIEQA
jgi:hypothetical protein